MSDTEGALCLYAIKVRIMSAFRDNFESIWSNLRQKITSTNPTDGVQISDLSTIKISGRKSFYC